MLNEVKSEWNKVADVVEPRARLAMCSGRVLSSELLQCRKTANAQKAQTAEIIAHSFNSSSYYRVRQESTTSENHFQKQT